MHNFKSMNTIRKYGLPFAVAVFALYACKQQSDEALTFETFEKQQQIENIAEEFRLDMRVELPVKGRSKAVCDSVRKQLMQLIFGIVKPNVAPQQLLQLYFDSAYAGYKRDREAIGNVKVAFDPFHEQMDGTVTLMTDSLLCYDLQTDTYYGGAHSQTTFNSYVFDLLTGCRLTEADLFLPEVDEQLLQLLSDCFVRELGEAFRGVKIMPNGNFTIIDEGLLYRINAYDLQEACVADNVDLLLPAADVLPLMKPNTVVSDYLKQHITNAIH